MTTFAKFQKLNMDTGPVGLYPVPEGFRSTYDCTPIGAQVFGSAGVDGIHFCRIRGFGDMIFAVSPANSPEDCVHPVAESFEDFLRLLLSCGGTDAMEQAHLWEKSQFHRFLAENPPVPEGKNLLNQISAALELTPMAQPYDYIRQLQAAFDYNRLRFRKAHREAMTTVAAETAPDWCVRFGSTLYGDDSRGNARPGEEIRVDRIFRWGNAEWHIPAVYLCGGGVVLDFCARVDRQAVEVFRDKWVSRLRSGLTDEEQERIRLENPLTFDLRPSLTVNGKTLHWNHGSSGCWCPALAEAEPGAENSHARRMLEHYGLDLRENWAVHRMSFPWRSRKPSVRSMLLTMIADDTEIPGIRFTANAEGTVSFTHPVTGTEHHLTVLETEAVEIPNHFADEDMEYPTHCTAVEYAVWPDLPQNALFLRDCCDGDQPRPKHGGSGHRGGHGAVMGVIRSRKNSETVTLPHSSTSLLRRSACSSLRFQTPESVEWRICFRAKLLEDQTEVLID